MTALADKSLLRREAEGRYRLHELLHQYATLRMAQSGAEVVELRERHCAYYADFLAQRAEDVNGRRQRQALAEIASELENVCTAWEYAATHRRFAEMQRATYPLYLFHDYSSRYREGFALFEQATQHLDALFEDRRTRHEVGPILAELLVCLGWLAIRLGELPQARALLERGQATLQKLGIPPRPAPGTDPLVALGTLANVLGNYAEAARLGEEARRRSEAQDDTCNLMYAYYVLANAAFACGQYADASRSGERARQIAEQLQVRWFMAYLVADLGHIARATGDYTTAARHYQTGYAIREEFDDPEGIAVALANLGQVFLLQGDLTEAQARFLRSLEIYRKIGNRGGEATVLHGLGMTALASGRAGEAAKDLHQALQIASTMGYASRVNAILAGVAEVFLHDGMPLPATQLLVAILRDPASDREASDRARTLLSHGKLVLSPDQYAAATHGRQAVDLPAVLAMLHSIVEHAGMPVVAGTATTSSYATRHLRQRNTETLHQGERPLTPRELAVLHLIAAGQSNQAIAAQLIITPGTAKWYVSQILSKLGVHSRTQAVARAQETGLLI